MENYFEIYKMRSQPLERLNTASKGDFIYTEQGDCFECIEDNHSVLFREFHQSVLNPGEKITSLEPEGLRLFWLLSDKSFKNAVRDLRNKKLDNYEGDAIEDTFKHGE